MRYFFSILICFVLISRTNAQNADLPVARQIISEMKSSDRGPFQRIKWFCKDGTTEAPNGGACRGHGGGIQHGEWSEPTKLLRKAGYPIATIYSSLNDNDVEGFLKSPRSLAPLLLERYLMLRDDGWIFREARSYRGAAQIEDEVSAAEKLLMNLLSHGEWVDNHFLLLREAARLLPRASSDSIVTQVRSEATRIAESDPGFYPLRNKIHGFPDPEDAERVREYATKRRSKDRYQELAALIDKLYGQRTPDKVINEIRSALATDSSRQEFEDIYQEYIGAKSLSERYGAEARVIAFLRDDFNKRRSPEERRLYLDSSIELEKRLFSEHDSLLRDYQRQNLAERLQVLRAALRGAYGSGLVSQRELYSASASILSLPPKPFDVLAYRNELLYLSRAPAWAYGELEWEFGLAVSKFQKIEPLAPEFMADRIRSSTMLLYSGVLDKLLEEVNQRVGLDQEFFGQPVSTQLRALNPGIARGRLVVIEGNVAPETVQPNDIIFVRATMADVPRVAGILTTHEGNSLAHVQLLARNLGIPNVVVEDSLVDQLKARAGERIVVASSPQGRVIVASDGARWNEVFDRNKGPVEEQTNQPDKYDLSIRRIIPLRELKAKDQGRIVGPKAAQLAELKKFFPGQVADAVAIPFGLFADILKLPLSDGQTIAEALKRESARLQRVGARQGDAELSSVLAEIREVIMKSSFSPEFTGNLRKAMRSFLGPEDSSAVFVRSDTNVEDGKSFSGAGLNLTVPNVVGFENILTAIKQVWASPFTERAFLWRQGNVSDVTQVYVSVVLMRTVPNEKSGVMITADVDTGNPSFLTVAVNEGVSGAVQGQSAETLLIERGTGVVKLLTEASATTKLVASPKGGLAKVETTQPDRILSEDEIVTLYRLAEHLPREFPQPADIEFGFIHGKLALFQIRPFLQSTRAQSSEFLREMDRRVPQKGSER